MAEVVVQLRTPSRAPAADGTASGGPEGSGDDVGGWLRRRFGLTSRPLHPGAGDPEALAWHTVEVPAGVDAESVAGALRARPDVAAAYVKPQAGPP
ncbi:hypothetical protein AF335_23870 [Streptomyces eurocidicus]|uniref:Uncharacterized protein n=1 Tax=Streptomyces eurocidicus TaxID=66423 RepID=A0A2N8NQR9_STREU|nr:hypothetical protein [Streptomyces eurocidicus]MBB5116870.1 hypothetical protein [Streptomyces eurocidicus]MBF6052824.1 hypothetical protein [Streptomyces eurocidicus]PNE31115.1 hypothetical protein AF335_23870 [Streptomyces eurocidicus]